MVDLITVDVGKAGPVGLGQGYSMTDYKFIGGPLDGTSRDYSYPKEQVVTNSALDTGAYWLTTDGNSIYYMWDERPRGDKVA